MLLLKGAIAANVIGVHSIDKIKYVSTEIKKYI